jgi:hypothetical protein
LDFIEASLLLRQRCYLRNKADINCVRLKLVR